MGQLAAESFEVIFYYLNYGWNENENELGRVSIPGIPASSTLTKTVTLTLPANFNEINFLLFKAYANTYLFNELSYLNNAAIVYKKTI